MRIPSVLLSFALLFAVSVSASGQLSSPARSVAQPDTSRWPDASSVKVGTKLKLATIADPKRKRPCKVAAFTTDQLACARSLGRKPLIFPRDEVASMYVPAQYSQPRAMQVCAMVAGAIVTGAVFLGVKAPPYGILGAIPLGLVGVALLGACGMADDSTEIAPMQVLYLRLGQQMPYPLY